MRIRLWRVVAAIAITAGSAALGDESGTVITKDGRTLHGQVTVDGDQVRVNRSGIMIVLSKDEVEEVRTSASVQADYRKRLAKLAKDDTDGHLRLAEWCRDRGRLDLAMERCEHVLDLVPDHANAVLLHKALEKRLESSPGKKKSSRKGKGAKRYSRGELLGKEDMSRVRLAELKPDERVPARFKNDVLDRFLDAVAGSEEYSQKDFRRTFKAKSSSDKLAEIVKATRMHFADDIDVRKDPEAIRVFRSDIMPIVRTNCATLKCHGGGGPGSEKMRLFSQSTTAASLTNFYVLDRFAKSSPGRATVRMFDRGYPEDGLFPHYLLPKDIAEPSLAHPGEIPVVANGKDDRRYVSALDWIKDVLRRPREDPGIEPAAKAKKEKAEKSKKDEVGKDAGSSGRSKDDVKRPGK